MFTAIAFDPDTRRWLEYTNPFRVLTAHHQDGVEPLLLEVEAAGEAGKTAVGYVAYEAAGGFDEALSHHEPTPGQPLAEFALFDAGRPIDLPSTPVDLDLTPQLSRDKFNQAIASIHQYLASGDCYQVNYTHPWVGQVPVAPLEIFGSLVRAQSSTLSVMIETDSQAICSASPELFFDRHDQQIRCEPMKGTRGRGRFTAEDHALRHQLEASEKDRAENLMIVDMIRNDLGRVASIGSVTASSLFEVRGYPTVWQQISTVTGHTDANLYEVFAALFPCASVTGAPKRRTMEIIRELEPQPRGIYTGAVGVVGPGRRARFNVAIRTLVLDKITGNATYGVGGGIVWDSEADAEWQECVTKTSVLKRHLPEFRLLETLKSEAGSVFLEAEHLDRMAASAAYFDYPFDREKAREMLSQAGKAGTAGAKGESLRLRLLLDQQGQFEMETYPLPASGGVRLKLASEPVQSDHLFLYHKTTERQVYDQARRALDGFDDVILYNERGELTETTISNLFLEIEGALLTPALTAGLLAGTFRRHLLETGQASEAVLTLDDLNRATRVFVGNSVRGLQEALYCSN